MTTRCGYVGIVGRPNVGKSTLLNRLVGQKISITAPKPQTTRHQILGIVTDEAGQAVFVDTPGLHTRQKGALNRYLNRAAASVLEGVDLVLFVVQAGRFNNEDRAVLARLENVRVPVILVVNKVDLMPSKEQLLPFLAEVSSQRDFAAVLPVVARRKKAADLVLKEVFRLLPEGDPLFDEDQITTASLRFMVGEIVREKLARLVHDEVPYSTTVEVERFAEEATHTAIDAVIYVERPGQKAIVIGKGGCKLKEIGTQARIDIERIIERKVMLKLWVKVREDWADDNRALRALGYQLHE
ncbi:MAG TPA: GTPase Era [Halothiobacillus sp.]|nr:GTPase Era [Halothiobacillus sp.]